MNISGSSEPQRAKPKNKAFPKISLVDRYKKKRAGKRRARKRLLECEKCEKKFENWWQIREHWESTGHKQPEQCLWCKKKTYTLQSHLCKKHWDKATMCPFCGQLFMFQEDFKMHELLHDGTVYKCFQCGRKRKSEERLRDHMYSHFLHEKYGCNECEKRFKKKKNIDRHLRVVHFICQYCGKKCDDLNELKMHTTIHNDLKCLLCQKVFSQKNRLKYHFQLQHGHQDFYKCTLCFQRFVNKSRLIDHLKVRHNGIANFSCKICDIPFLYWQNYVNHLEFMHIKLPPENVFCCSFCDFKSERKDKLLWHVEKVSGTGFFCKNCQIRLECKGMFDMHMQKHSGEKVWTCDHCPRSYLSDDTLKHHMSIVHKKHLISKNPRIYPCPQPDCNKYYLVKNSLSRHVRREHKDDTVVGTSLLCGDTVVTCSTSLTRIRRRRRIQRQLNISVKIDSGQSQTSTYSPKKGYHHKINLPNVTEVNVYHCRSCKKFWFNTENGFWDHMNGHNKEVWDEKCDECDVELDTPESAVKHYVEDHLRVQFMQ